MFRNYPGAKRGGKYIGVGLTRNGWLPRGAKNLKGNNAHAYSDVNDDNEANPSEEVSRFDKRLVPFNIKGMSFCKDFPCSWDPDKPFSWKTNREQNATQVFYFVNKFHDHLLANPIGFTEAAGNFEAVNSTQVGQGPRRGPDPDDGRRQHRQRPPGQQPRRQRQHEHAPRRHGADDADVPAAPAGHARTPTATRSRPSTSATRPTPSTTSTPTASPTDWSSTCWATAPSGRVQSGAMGEAWGDWYAADLLVSDGLEVDKKGKADLELSTGTTARRGDHPDPGHRLHSVVAGRPDAPGGRDRPHAAATRTPTTARCSGLPRCTPTARSGARPCGRSATRSAPGCRRAW